MFVLMACKLTGGCIYQLVSEEFSFTATCSVKEYSKKISFHGNN